jgi:hypothetical protein
MRISDFRARYLDRERTKKIVIDPVHPKNQGEDRARGYTLRVDLADLIELYVKEIEAVL